MCSGASLINHRRSACFSITSTKILKAETKALPTKQWQVGLCIVNLNKNESKHSTESLLLGVWCKHLIWQESVSPLHVVTCTLTAFILKPYLYVYCHRARLATAPAQWCTSWRCQPRACTRNPDTNPKGIMCPLDGGRLGLTLRVGWCNISLFGALFLWS